MAIRKPLPFLLDEMSPHLRRIALSAIFARPSNRSAQIEIYERPFTVRASDSGDWVVKDMTSHTGIIGNGSDLLGFLAYVSGSDVCGVARSFLSPLVDFQSDIADHCAAVVARWHKQNGGETITSTAPKRLTHCLRIDASIPGRLAHLIAQPIAKRVLNRRYDAATFNISSLGDVIAKSYNLPMDLIAYWLIGAIFAVQFNPTAEAKLDALRNVSDTGGMTDLFARGPA